MINPRFYVFLSIMNCLQFLALMLKATSADVCVCGTAFEADKLFITQRQQSLFLTLLKKHKTTASICTVQITNNKNIH